METHGTYILELVFTRRMKENVYETQKNEKV